LILGESVEILHVSSGLESQDQQDLEAERQEMRHEALESEEIDLLIPEAT